MSQLPSVIDKGLLLRWGEGATLFPGASGRGRRAKQSQWPEKILRERNVDDGLRESSQHALKCASQGMRVGLEQPSDGNFINTHVISTHIMTSSVRPFHPAL